MQQRSSPPAIEHFNKSYDSVYDDLIKTNNFSFIYKSDYYNFNLAETYIDSGPQIYYLGYKNGQLHFIFPEKKLSALKSIFESKDRLYIKTGKILKKIEEISHLKTQSTAYTPSPKNSLIYDLTEDTLNFTIYGTIALAGLPWVVGGYAEHLAKEYRANKLNLIRLGMSSEEVNQIIPDRLDRKKIDQYDVEAFTSKEGRWYTNALLIFEQNKLVCILRNVTDSPISEYYKKL